jgi:protein-S-isoprenylcysteine O-methyltransferase Ste14
MEPVTNIKYLILSLLVIAWCFLHSAMIATAVTEFLRKRLGTTYRFYRLFFNTVSVLTLIPIIWYESSVRTKPLFQWQGYLRVVQIVLLGTAVLLFFLGAQRYDAAWFLGLKQLRERATHQGISAGGQLDTSGVLSIVRHPWYIAGILLIWARPLDISTVLVNVILSMYLIIGAYREERKLVREFGEQYRDYRTRVSMLLPYKWLKSKLTK